MKVQEINNILEVDMKKILKTVNGNINNYSWQELNCFYRVFAIIFKQYANDASNLFLLFISFNVLFRQHTKNNISEYNRFNSMFDICSSFLQNCLGIKINVVYNKDENEFNKNIINCIDKNHNVIIPIDSYYVYYSENYLERHARHYTIVKGYDREKKLYFIYDNLHIDLGASVIYDNFMLEVNKCYKMVESFCQQFDDKKIKDIYFWEIFDVEKKNSIQDSLMQLIENILIDNKSFYGPEKLLFNILINREYEKNILHEISMCNIRKVYYDTLVCYLKMCNYDIQNFKIEKEIDEISKLAEKIKAIIIYKYHRRSNDFEKLEILINKLAKKERKIIEKVYYIVKNNNVLSNIVECKEKFFIKNNKKAIINFISEDNFEIKLSNKCIYDLWFSKDDACQILYKIMSDNCLIQARINMECLLGSCGSCGIVIVFETGDKVLFGNLRNYYVGIYYPGNKNEELYLKTEEVIDGCYYKVEKIENRLCFFIRKNELDWKIIYEMEIKNSINYIGLYAKTWEYVDLKANFTEINVY